MGKLEKRFYWTVFLILLLLSVWPVIMGAGIFLPDIINEIIRPEDYVRYIIPYSALCLSVLVSLTLYPLISKLKRYSSYAAAIFGVGLFLALELYMEKITVNSPEMLSAFQWQLTSYTEAPAAIQAVQKLYDNTFRTHYFIISIVTVILITGIVYSYKDAVYSHDSEKKMMFYFQIVCTALFIALSISASIASFFKQTVDYLLPYSSLLTGLYTIILGAAFGSYIGGLVTGKGHPVFIGLPSVAAVLAASAMFYGEYKILDGVLYRFGYSRFFQPLPYTIFEPVNFLAILASGVFTALVAYIIRFFSIAKIKQRALHKIT